MVLELPANASVAIRGTGAELSLRAAAKIRKVISVTFNERRQTDIDMTSGFDNYWEPDNHGEPNTDRMPACDDRGARIFRIIFAVVLWVLAISIGVKALALADPPGPNQWADQKLSVIRLLN
jgi:hypothetical protein